MDPNEKIQLDDITFDDVIGGDGVDTVAEIEPIEEVAEQKEEVKEEPQAELEDIDEEEELEEEIEEEDEQEEVEEEKSDEEVESTEDSTVVSEILDSLGYEGEYEDTAEGLTAMTKDIASQMADERIDEVLEKFPLVKKHMEYVLAGGESQKFMKAFDPTLDYNQMEIAEDDSRSQKAILADYFNQKGHDADFIKEMLEDYEDSGKLFKKAEAAKQALGKVQAQEKEQLVERQKAELQKQQEQQVEFWNGVQETIKESKEFAGLQVPEREKTKFFNYLSKPVTKEGYTQRDLDHSEAEMEVKLAIDYLMYKGFNLENIINKKAKTTATKTLRQKIAQNEETVKSARKRSTRKKSFDLDNLDLNI
jgi:hypothetical protein|tara:strand:+ start:94 stop:1185 length:1092 start_codon:yes stop_codon:yes gene_type:complete